MPVNAQVVHLGAKAGFNLSWVALDDANFKKEVSVLPVPGFNAGLAASFKLKDRFFLHTEALFSTKGKTVTGDLELKDRMIYYFIDVPITYNVFFDGQLKMNGVKQFKWYAGLGPNFSYWLGGRGTISHLELKEYDQEEINYKIRFGERRSDGAEPAVVYISNAKRFQLGLNFGGGIFLEPLNGGKIMLDLRFELGSTWLGKAESADYVFPQDYSDNLQARNMGVRASIMYMFEFSTDKKIMNKGKSTLKNKKRR